MSAIHKNDCRKPNVTLGIERVYLPFQIGDMILCESIGREYSTQLLVRYNMDEDYMYS